MKQTKHIALWVLTGFFFMSALLFFPSIASILMLLFSIVVAPIPRWQGILNCFINKKVKIAVAVVLAILSILVAPTQDPQNGEPDANVSAVEVTNEATDTPKVTETEAPKPTETNTPKPAATDTPKPTATNTPKPTATHTPKPTATNTPKPTATNTPTPTATVPAGTEYVLNTNTDKFHYPWCSSVDQMNEENKRFFTGTREECIQMGYEPCKRCHP